MPRSFRSLPLSPCVVWWLGSGLCLGGNALKTCILLIWSLPRPVMCRMSPYDVDGCCPPNVQSFLVAEALKPKLPCSLGGCFPSVDCRHSLLLKSFRSFPCPLPCPYRATGYHSWGRQHPSGTVYMLQQ